MESISRLISKYRHFILYGIIGGSCATLDFIIFSVLTFFTVNLMTANAVGVICGITTSFLLNREYNFKVKNDFGKRFLLFSAIGVFGLLTSSLWIYLFVSIMSWSGIYAKATSILVVSIIQFILNKTITFRINET